MIANHFKSPFTWFVGYLVVVVVVAVVVVVVVVVLVPYKEHWHLVTKMGKIKKYLKLKENTKVTLKVKNMFTSFKYGQTRL